MEIITASPPDRDFLVTEIWVENEQLAEINREQGAISVEFYSRRDGQPWRLDFEEAVSALAQAEAELLAK
jgi:hypothetical protein